MEDDKEEEEGGRGAAVVVVVVVVVIVVAVVVCGVVEAKMVPTIVLETATPAFGTGVIVVFSWQQEVMGVVSEGLHMRQPTSPKIPFLHVGLC